METQYSVKIYNEYKIQEFRFVNLKEAKSFFDTYLNNVYHTDFEALIIELHSSKQGNILRYVNNIEFYESRYN